MMSSLPLQEPIFLLAPAVLPVRLPARRVPALVTAVAGADWLERSEQIIFLKKKSS